MIKPTHFLIDTNVWVSLLADVDDTSLVEWLEKLVENKMIQLLVPVTLTKEWKNQSEDRLKKLHTKAKEAGNTTHQEESVVTSFEDYLQRSKDLASRISVIMEKGMRIEISKEVSAEAIRRFHLDLPPFHKNEKSNGDALIFLSTVEYLKMHDADSFVFVTNNTSDFGDEDRPKEKLHPDLETPNLTVQYFIHLAACRAALKSQPGFESHETQVFAERYVVTVLQKRNMGMLEFLFLIISKIKEQVGFVPCNLLARITPFKIAGKKNRFAYYSGYTIHTNNELLVDFFESIQFRGQPRFKRSAEYENTQENLDRLAYVIKHLNNNMVFYISEQHSSRTIDIRARGKHVVCDCLICLYDNMELVKSLQRIKNADNENSLDLAFVASLLDCNETACMHTIRAAEEAEGQKKRLLLYKLLYHIFWLEQVTFVKQGIVDAKKLKEWKERDHRNVFIQLLKAGGFEKDFGDYLYETAFEGQYRKEIGEALRAIREHYRLQLDGGTSNNSNLYNLSWHFTEFEQFLKANRMPFFRFSNFSKIFDMYAEGLFLSLNMNEYQASRLRGFNDQIIRQLFQYGSADTITKLANQYARNGVEYAHDDSYRPVTRMILNFLRDLSLVMEEDAANLPEKPNFKSLFDKWHTVCALLSVIKFNKEFIVECSDLMYGFLYQRKERNNGSYSHLSSFLSTRLSWFDKGRQKKWLMLCIKEKSYHGTNLLLCFTQGNLKNRKLLTTAEDFAAVEEHLLLKYLTPNSSFTEVVIQLKDTMSLSNADKLSRLIIAKLEDSFHYDLFYRAAIMGVIDPMPMLKDYFDLFAFMQKRTRNKHSFFLENDVYMSGLNDLVNLCFSLDIDIPSNVAANFKGCSLYYDWLLDMKGFDYKKFKPIWITLYATRFYLVRIFSVPQVKEAVREWLKTNNHEKVARYYALYSS